MSWPGFDAAISRISYDPFWRPGWRRLARQKALHINQRVVGRIVSSRKDVNSRLAWQELSLKLRAFALFSLVDVARSLQSPDEATLPALVKTAQSLNPDEIPWMMEGIGQLVSQRPPAGDGLPVHLLDDQRLPDWSLSTLHTGLGIALAVRFLSAVKASDPDQSVAKKLERFLSLSDRCARPGYTGMVNECLGFVLRFLHPHHLAPADAYLQENRPDLVANLWHGVGRALYFLPSNLMPGRSAPWRAFAMAESEAPHEIGRQNVMAGLAWPFLLVNWRQPKILEAVLNHHQEQLRADGCFSSGLGGAMAAWVESTPRETGITDLLDHRPQQATSDIGDAWESLVRTPCLHALTRTYPHLKKKQRLDELFRYPLPTGSPISRSHR